MRTLSIVKNDNEITLAVDSISLLTGYSGIWYDIIFDIKDYFNNRASDVSLRFDDTSINKKDWECLFLTSDTALSFDDKLTLKSPIYAELLKLATNHLESPEYIQLQNCWQDFAEVLVKDFKDKMDLLKLELYLTYENLPLSNLLTNLKMQTDEKMSLFQQRITLLKWFLKNPQEKQRLIIFEYPELYADEEQLFELNEMLNKLNSATYVILLSNYEFSVKEKNIIYNNSIINKYYLNLFYDVIVDEAPFILEQEEFDTAMSVLINYGHKWNFYVEINKLNLKMQFIVILMCKLVKFQIDYNLIENLEVKKFFCK